MHNQLHQFIADDQIKKFKYEECHDLVAPDDGVQIAADVFRFLSFSPGKGQVVVVKAIAPYLLQRTDPGGADESVKILSRLVANRWFSVTPYINNSIPLISGINVNAYADLATANDGERIELPGGTALTDDPWIIEFFPKDPADSYVVRSKKTFSLNLKVIPLDSTDPISNPVVINGAKAATRVDFAGAIVYGVTMPETVYDALKKKWKSGQ